MNQHNAMIVDNYFNGQGAGIGATKGIQVGSGIGARAIIVDGLLHAVVEQSLDEGLWKFIKYDVLKLLRGLINKRSSSTSRRDKV